MCLRNRLDPETASQFQIATNQNQIKKLKADCNHLGNDVQKYIGNVE